VLTDPTHEALGTTIYGQGFGTVDYGDGCKATITPRTSRRVGG